MQRGIVRRGAVVCDRIGVHRCGDQYLTLYCGRGYWLLVTGIASRPDWTGPTLCCYLYRCVPSHWAATRFMRV